MARRAKGRCRQPWAFAVKDGNFREIREAQKTEPRRSISISSPGQPWRSLAKTGDRARLSLLSCLPGCWLVGCLLACCLPRRRFCRRQAMTRPALGIASLPPPPPPLLLLLLLLLCAGPMRSCAKGPEWRPPQSLWASGACTIERRPACVGDQREAVPQEAPCITPQQFEEEFAGRRPILLQGLAASWPAMTVWGRDKQAFLERYSPYTSIEPNIRATASSGLSCVCAGH